MSFNHYCAFTHLVLTLAMYLFSINIMISILKTQRYIIVTCLEFYEIGAMRTCMLRLAFAFFVQ